MIPTKESIKRFEAKELDRRVEKLLTEWKNEDNEKSKVAIRKVIDDLENKRSIHE